MGHLQRDRGSWLLGTALGMLALAGGPALADTIALQANSNNRLVSALPLGRAQAGIGFGSITSFSREFLGNGYAVLRNPLSGLCLEVGRDGVLRETALRDGRAAEQFRFDTTGGVTTLLARANARYVSVSARPDGTLAANGNATDAAAAFTLLARDAGETAAIALDPLHAEQTIVGFGGALVFNEARLAQHPYRDEIFHALYDPKDGLGITFLRIGNNYGITASQAGGYADENPVLVASASKALGRKATLIMSGWGPPAALKSNNSVNGGTLRKVDGQYDYAGYAQWWKESILSWRAQGIDPDFVSIQNEPEVIVSYISNHLNPQEGVPYGGTRTEGDTTATFGATEAASYGKALHAVSEAFGTLPAAPLLLGPEVDGPGFNKVEDFLHDVNLDELAGLAHHQYDTENPADPDSFAPHLQEIADAHPEKPKFMTEWLSNDAPIVEAKAIHDTLVVENLNAYIKWSLANAATVASAIYDDDGTKPPSTWTYPHGYHLNDNYYVLKHYAYYVRPGFQRVDSYAGDPDLRVSSFVDSKPADPFHRRAATVALNVSATRSVPVTLQLPPFPVRHSDVRLTAFNGTERWTSLGAWHPGARYVLPPNAMLTIAFNPE